MSRSRMLQVFKRKPNAIVTYKPQPMAVVAHVAVPSPRLMGVESTFLQRIYSGYLKFTQLFQTVKQPGHFTGDIHPFGISGSVVASVIQRHQLLQTNTRNVIPGIGNQDDSNKSNPLPNIERMAVAPVIVSTSTVDQEDDVQEAEPAVILPPTATTAIMSQKPAPKHLSFAPPVKKDEPQDDSEDEFYTKVKKAKPAKAEINDDSLARYYLKCRLEEARTRAEALNSRKYWNGRKKAAYIFDAIAAVETVINKNPKSFIHNPDEYLENILSDGFSVNGALAWHRHRFFAENFYRKKETISAMQFKQTPSFNSIK